MRLVVARTLRYLAHRLAGPHRPNQNVARTNAARASAILRERRHEQEDVDAYLQARGEGEA